MPNDLINEFNQLKESIKKLEKQKKKVATKLSKHGYFVNENDELVENKKTLGLFWEISYCDYYVGEHGMYTTEAEGATEISQEQFDEVKQFFEDENYEAIGEIFEELTEFPDWKLEGSLKYGKLYIDVDSLNWVTEEKGEQDGDMNSGSRFEIKETTLKKIESTPFTYEEDVAP